MRHADEIGPMLLVDKEVAADRIDAYVGVFDEEQFVNAATGEVEEFWVWWERDPSTALRCAQGDGRGWREVDWGDVWMCVAAVVIAAAVGWMLGGG